MSKWPMRVECYGNNYEARNVYELKVLTQLLVENKRALANRYRAGESWPRGKRSLDVNIRSEQRMSMSPSDAATMAMPRYRSHKEVWALKIERIDDPNNATDGSRLLAFEGYAPICVTGDWMTRFRPEVGGYYVRYDDGYTSFSPAKAFEEGYTRLWETPSET